MPVYLPAEERREIIRYYGITYGINVLVETGTNDGATPWALKNYFKKIYTIELGSQQFRKAVVRFKEYPHIQCLLGDSGKLIRGILNKLEEPAVFWLDGHYSGPGTAQGDVDTPVETELLILREYWADGHVILVDDARLFGGGEEHPVQGEGEFGCYPSQLWVKMLADEMGYRYELKHDIMRLTPDAKTD